MESAAKRRRRHARSCVRKKKRPKRKVPLQPVPPAPTPPAPDPPAEFRLTSPVAIYSGNFGVREAERLLWRAGFGPSPGHAEALAAMGLHRAVAALTRPSGAATLTGAAPTDEDGNPLAPADLWGHDHLWWLDRMVRTDQPLVERMTLVWHDWFATSNDGVGQQQLMLDQNELFRRSAFGSFEQLLHDVTQDPAMIVWLNLNQNTRWNPNENYAREVMELFTLGADRGAYSEQDVRQLARALTGFDFDWSDELGMHNFRYVPTRHDNGSKTVFGHDGRVDLGAGSRRCACTTRCTRPSSSRSCGATSSRRALRRRPPGARGAVRVERLPGAAGARGDPAAPGPARRPAHGQAAHCPALPGSCAPSSARSTASTGSGTPRTPGSGSSSRPTCPGGTTRAGSTRARFAAASSSSRGRSPAGCWTVDAVDDYDATETPDQAVAAARAWAHDPNLSAETVAGLATFAADALAGAAGWQLSTYRGLRQNALRHLILASPDYQTS